MRGAWIQVGAAVVAVSWGTVAHAQEETPAPAAPEEAQLDDEYIGQLNIGVRLGYAIPMGEVGYDSTTGSSEHNQLNELVAGAVPIWGDLLYKPLPFLALGGYLMWGPAFAQNATGDGIGCPAGATCTAGMVRIGAQLHLELLPRKRINPWVGGGAGYEFALQGITAADDTKTRALWQGIEWLHLQVGADFKPRRTIGVGPFASFAIGRFDDCSYREEKVSPRCDIDEKGLHEWLTLGVRGSFDVLKMRRQSSFGPTR